MAVDKGSNGQQKGSENVIAFKEGLVWQVAHFASPKKSIAPRFSCSVNASRLPFK